MDADCHDQVLIAPVALPGWDQKRVRPGVWPSSATARWSVQKPPEFSKPPSVRGLLRPRTRALRHPLVTPNSSSPVYAPTCLAVGHNWRQTTSNRSAAMPIRRNSLPAGFPIRHAAVIKDAVARTNTAIWNFLIVRSPMRRTGRPNDHELAVQDVLGLPVGFLNY